MVQQAFGFSGGVDYGLLKLFSEQKYDGYFGGALLAAGFTLQAAASAGERSAFFPVAPVLVLVLPVAGGTYFLCRRRGAIRLFVRAFNTLPEYETQAPIVVHSNDPAREIRGRPELDRLVERLFSK